MKYTRKFLKDADYQAYIMGEGNEVFLPNISYTADKNVVYFNPVFKSKISGKFYVTDTTIPYFICMSYVEGDVWNDRVIMEVGLKLEDIKSFKVDRVEAEPLIEMVEGLKFICCRFTTFGVHTFEMELNDNIVPCQTFRNSPCTKLDLSQFNIRNVTNMTGMFYGCTGLTSLDSISNWNVRNVTNMTGMFSGCTGLTSLDSISNWDVSNVTDMKSMFSNCTGLTSLDLSNWDVSNVTNMTGMFSGCTGLTSLDSISNWNVRNVTNMTGMFYHCTGLTSLDLSNWDVSNVTDMNAMFYYCTGLTSLDLSNWDVSNVTNMGAMFYYCTGLTSLDLSNWDISNVTDMSLMFSRCNSLTEIKMGGNPCRLTDCSLMFNFVKTNGSFYYNSAYDYNLICTQLPSTWSAIPCTLIDGVLIPNK